MKVKTHSVIHYFKGLYKIRTVETGTFYLNSTQYKMGAHWNFRTGFENLLSKEWVSVADVGLMWGSGAWRPPPHRGRVVWGTSPVKFLINRPFNSCFNGSLYKFFTTFFKISLSKLFYFYKINWLSWILEIFDKCS